jgi:hypothetical protein
MLQISLENKAFSLSQVDSMYLINASNLSSSFIFGFVSISSSQSANSGLIYNLK